MPEEEEEELAAAPPKKGSSKIAIIGICVMMLITGGYLGLKLRSGGAAKVQAPKLKLGADIVQVHEFLVNLQDPGTPVYLRTEISVQLAKDAKKEDLDKYSAPIQAAITAVLRSYSTTEIRKPGTMAKLGRQVAKAANDAMVTASSGEDHPVKEEGDNTHHDEFDSDTGPILKVYFTSFAFQ